MDETTRSSLDDVFSKDAQAQNKAYTLLLSVTEQPVDWAYDAWGDLKAGLSHKDNRVRAITSQILCNLAKSDPENRMRNDFEALLAVTKDERFVTARHCLQALWKIGLAGEQQRKMLLDGLTQRYHESAAEKNGTLIRYDILVGMRNLYDAVGGEDIRERALALIDAETDPKYHKKYAGVWKGAG